jgi:hypothetical protein
MFTLEELTFIGGLIDKEIEDLIKVSKGYLTRDDAELLQFMQNINAKITEKEIESFEC